MNDRDLDSDLTAINHATGGKLGDESVGAGSASRPGRDPVGSRTTFVGALAAVAITFVAVSLLTVEGTTEDVSPVVEPNQSSTTSAHREAGAARPPASRGPNLPAAGRVQAPAEGTADEQESCYASARTRGQAVAAYERSCSAPRVDCDPVDGGWLCSGEVIGRNSPNGPPQPQTAPTTTSTVAPPPPEPTTTIVEPPPASQPPITPPASGEQADEFACLEEATSVKALTGLQDGVTWFRDLPSGAAVDLRQAFFESITPDGDNWYPLQVRSPSGRDICMAGGTVTGTRPLDISWNYTYQHRQNHAGVRIETPGAAVHGMHIYNTWDGVRVLEGDWEIAHTWLEYIRDDCIENDSIQSGRVYDSLFDGCFVGHSNRPGRRDSRSSGSGKMVTFEKSLFRLEPMPYPNVGVNYPNLLDIDGVPHGHAGFLKGARTKDPTYVVKDSIFLFQWNPRDGVLDLDKIDECSNNTVVWLGPGSFPGRLPPGCFTVTTDINVWKDAVRDWHIRHPNVGENRKKPVSQQGDIWTYFPRVD